MIIMVLVAESTVLTSLKASEWGLRPLVVHVDGGWNSELAVANIERFLITAILICTPMWLIGVNESYN